MPYEQTFGNRDFEKVMLPASKDLYDAKVVPGALLPKQLGNSYTCSLYSGLASLVGTHGDSLEGKLATLFSYGSGLCSTMFGVSFRSTTSPVFNLENMQHKVGNSSISAPFSMIIFASYLFDLRTCFFSSFRIYTKKRKEKIELCFKPIVHRSMFKHVWHLAQKLILRNSRTF